MELRIHGSVLWFVCLNLPIIIYWALYIEFCSKIPRRLHSLPTDVDIPKVTKNLSLGRGIDHQVPSSKGRGQCWMVIWVTWKWTGKALPAGKEEIESNLQAPEMFLAASHREHLWVMLPGPYLCLSVGHQLCSPSSRHCLKPLPWIPEGKSLCPPNKPEMLGHHQPSRKPSTSGTGQLRYKSSVPSLLRWPNPSFKINK